MRHVLASLSLRYGACDEPPVQGSGSFRCWGCLLLKPSVFVETHESKPEHGECRQVLNGNISSLNTTSSEHLWREHVKFQAFSTSTPGCWLILPIGSDHKDLNVAQGTYLLDSPSPLAMYSQLLEVSFTGPLLRSM